MRTKAGAVLGLGILLSAPGASFGQSPGRTPVVTTPHFAFYSDLDPNVNDALIAAGAGRQRAKPELFHSGDEVVLFFTTGEAVRHILDEGGKPGYTPMVYAIFDRGAWPGYRKPIESAWRPYIDGDRTLSEAAANLIEALRRPQQPQPDVRAPEHP